MNRNRFPARLMARPKTRTVVVPLVLLVAGLALGGPVGFVVFFLLGLLMDVSLLNLMRRLGLTRRARDPRRPTKRDD